jgi:small subunit ribosomal protein S21
MPKSNYREGGLSMPSIRVRDTASFESALKHFKKQCEREGILSEVKKREHFEKPSVKKKKKVIAARTKAVKRMRFSSAR